ncbi:MAG: hypothetical protein LBG48_05025 [Rickettsiales bacterium]|jgi:UDP-glucose 4-epimerase|nr:hypothetical protein [Rickettsiales bacterium]
MINRNIVVTGGAEYIGSCFCGVTKQSRYNPVTYDNLLTSFRYALICGNVFTERCLGWKIGFDNIKERIKHTLKWQEYVLSEK